jgi:hypothetical protein
VRKLHIPDEALIDLIIEHQGAVTEAQLLEAGYTADQIQDLWKKRVLTRRLWTGKRDGRYTLTNVFAFVDGLVLTHWAAPEGIIGRLSALVFHELTVALPIWIDVYVPPGWKSPLPRNFGLRPFVLPPELRDYGVMTVYPSPPETVPIAMYSPAVALVQMLADEEGYEEFKQEALWMYRHFYEKDERELQEAAERYQITVPEDTTYSPR